jgi:hypothetical protein
MIEHVIQQWNLNKAYQKVCANKGAGGVDGMEISQLKAHLQINGQTLVEHIRNGSYHSYEFWPKNPAAKPPDKRLAELLQTGQHPREVTSFGHLAEETAEVLHLAPLEET